MTDITPESLLEESKVLASKAAGATVENVLIGNLKRWDTNLKISRDNIATYKMTSKATGLLLSKLKAKRLVADRNGGGSKTSRLTKQINIGRNIINESRQMIEEEIISAQRFFEIRKTVLGALRLYYSQM